MKSNTFDISAEALSDIEDIWHYTFMKWSKDQADRYFNLIIKEIEFISKNPLQGKPVDIPLKNYRTTRVKSHLIFYRIKSERVEIIRILHQKMNTKRRLK